MEEAKCVSLLACEPRCEMAQQSLGRFFGWLPITKSALLMIFSFITSFHTHPNAIQPQLSYVRAAESGLTTLQQWYNQSSGLWDSTGWWNSANCLTVLADFAAIDPYATAIGAQVFPNTLMSAQRQNLQMKKVMVGGAIRTQQGVNLPIRTSDFLNDYYDDEGWWALAWIRVYDVTGGMGYLQAAITLFDDMTGGWNSSRCGGGIWWDKAQTYENAIANELFISVAAHLAVRAPNNNAASYYQEWALKAWAWFQQSSMINVGGTVNDGLDLTTCKNNGGIVWSYNQGVVIGGLVELAKTSLDVSYILEAQAIADAAIASLTDANGILHDPCEPNCGGDGSQFKGVLMRNVRVLHDIVPSTQYRRFLEANADAIWGNDRSSNNELSVVWSGPFVTPANASTQSSALDALVAAVAVQ